jgi:hypothetical protein
VDGDRHHEMQIVSLAPEERMGLDTHRYQQISRLAAVPAGVSPAGKTNPCAIGQPCWNIDGDRLGPEQSLLAAARRTIHLGLPSRTTAFRTRLREHHVAPRRLDRTRSRTTKAWGFRGLQATDPLARPALFLTGRGQFPLDASHGLLEPQRDGLMKVGPTRRRVLGSPHLALLQDLSEEIAKGRRGRAADADREIKALEAD